MTDYYAASKRNFLGYAKHLNGMTIHLDQGLYRHIQFGTRGQVGWFEIVTWPHRLSITGDIGGWTFGRIEDMFEFFEHPAESSIQPVYWAEKVVAGASPMAFSPDVFTRRVVREFWSRRDQCAGERGELFREIRDCVLDYSEDEYAARRALETFHYVPRRDGNPGFGLRPAMAGELRGYSPHYLRACQAIVWGIEQYRAHKAAASKAVTA